MVKLAVSNGKEPSQKSPPTKLWGAATTCNDGFALGVVHAQAYFPRWIKTVQASDAIACAVQSGSMAVNFCAIVPISMMSSSFAGRVCVVCPGGASVGAGGC